MPEQLGFGFDRMQDEKEAAHLPSDMDAGILAYRALLEQHHRAMLDADEKLTMAIRKDAMWPGFSAHVVEADKPFFSETGFRSFIGVHAQSSPGITPDLFAREVIAAHIEGECKGKLRPVKQEYRNR